MWPFTRRETRAVQVTQASPDLARALGLTLMSNAVADVPVTTDTALGVPAVWSAVNFIAGTVAGLPLHVYRKTANGRERLEGGLANILHDAWNPEWSSFAGRKYAMERILTSGRAIIFIERSPRGTVLNLWPLQPDRVTVERDNRTGGRRYRYRRVEGGESLYESSEIIDVPFMLHADGITHYGPIERNKNAIALAIAATQYGAQFFRGGGVPPFAVTGNFQSGQAMRRAADDLTDAVAKAAAENRSALVLPAGLDIKPIGGDPEKAQLVELKRFTIEEVARIYSIPPTFLQDLSNGTYSNTEQNDLHFVKHTVKRWVEAFEQEMNLKLFGRSSGRYVEFNVDGLLRGDFKTRMEGHAAAIQHGIKTPNEARTEENLPSIDGGERAYMQGAMMPITALPTAQDTTGGANDV